MHPCILPVNVLKACLTAQLERSSSAATRIESFDLLHGCGARFYRKVHAKASTRYFGVLGVSPVLDTA